MLDFRVETFLTVCRTMNFTRAAELLHITQPAVTQHIHTLEKQYGARFFRYQGKQIFLTEAGQLFLQTATTFYQDDQHLRDAIRQLGTRRSIRFGATLTIGEYVMPPVLTGLLKEEPTLRLRMIVENTKELLRLLDNGEIEFAIVEGFFPRQEYESLSYCIQPYIPVCAPSYTFSRPILRLEDLLEERLLIREPGSGTREVLSRALEDHNLTLSDFPLITELGSLNVIKKMVCAGAGIAFFYLPVVQEELEKGQLREISLENCALSHAFNFIWRKNSTFDTYYQDIFRLFQTEETFRTKTTE
ncbi:LysR family transcriptional regulator [Anaerotignum lactatifermentans]|uniref:LysR family transcriptional regulator n=1 Tax=Anaerotignum lactatifermentans TaxID=160404 RepID=A0ABS2G7Y7_9FIRM|nr:LysR family transcriptional regulator [Anaerotignum lactatifermentans]MBM6828304.1 LysR family transcriptional regulator [Anaerotignum lactatifermentans]MBM6877584.1 LysR family transcriptional regulator [Anaerotignum lactatifermentans]MBM6949887.1 LysR family transcriptional regulator [Anaerotignum lactatifermentans]